MQTQAFSVAFARDTETNWLITNPVIGAGIVIIVQSLSSSVSDQFKIGDGIRAYSALPILNVAGNGAYLGLAITSTSPPVLAANAYYFTKVTGTFTNLGGVVVVSTSLLSIISYNFGTTTWTTSEIIDTGSTLPTPTLQQVLDTGNTAVNTGGHTALQTLADALNYTIFGATVGFQLVRIIGNVLLASLAIAAGIPTFTLIAGNDAIIVTPMNYYVRNISAGITRGVTTAYNKIAYSWNNGTNVWNLNINFPITLSRDINFSIPIFRVASPIALAGDGVSPTKTAGTGAGTSPTITFTSGSDDTKGLISLATGTSCAATALIMTVFFNSSYGTGATPRVLIAPANAAAAGLYTSGRMPFIATINETNFTIQSNATALVDSTTYLFTYHVLV